MKTSIYHIDVDGLSVEVVRKKIKNINLRVYPPNGRVRVTTPLKTSKETVRLLVVGKMSWIKKHQAKFDEQPSQAPIKMVSGESHYFMGKQYQLQVVEKYCPPSVELVNDSTMLLSVSPGFNSEYHKNVLQEWYRQQLKEFIPPILLKWENTLNVKASFWGVKKMKTRWGSCNTTKQRIWINLHLAKKPIECLEYIIVHELMHLLEGSHNKRFYSLMDQYLPDWKSRRELLNQAPFIHEDWDY